MTMHTPKQIVLNVFSIRKKETRVNNSELDKAHLISNLLDLPNISIPTKVEVLNAIELVTSNQGHTLTQLEKLELESALSRLHLAQK